MKQVTKEWLDRAQDDLGVAKEISEIEHLTAQIATKTLSLRQAQAVSLSNGHKEGV